MDGLSARAQGLGVRSLGRLSAGQLLDPVSLTMTASGAAAAAARGDLAGLLAALGRPVHWGLASFAPGVALDDAHRAALRAFRPDQPYRSAAFHDYARAASMLLVVCGALHYAERAPEGARSAPGHPVVMRTSSPASLALRVLRNRLALRDKAAAAAAAAAAEAAEAAAAAAAASEARSRAVAYAYLGDDGDGDDDGGDASPYAADGSEDEEENGGGCSGCGGGADGAAAAKPSSPAFIAFLEACSLQHAAGLGVSPRSGRRAAKLLGRRRAASPAGAARARDPWALCGATAVAMEA